MLRAARLAATTVRLGGHCNVRVMPNLQMVPWRIVVALALRCVTFNRKRRAKLAVSTLCKTIMRRQLDTVV